MLQLLQSEATAARRRVPFSLVDDTDGKTPETGITFSAGDIKVSKNGATEANHGGTVTELAGGDYYYEATQGELDTLGMLRIRFVKSGCRTFRAVAQVVAFNPYDAVRMGQTALPNANAGANGGLPTVDGNNRIVGIQGTKTTLDALNDVSQAQVNAEADQALADYDPPTRTELTSDKNEILTRLGSPQGASLSADLLTLLTRLSATRAGFLDNLNVGGPVASSAEVTAIQNNTRVVRVVPSIIERPDSGSLALRIELFIYDAAGNMEAPDSAPTLGVVNQSGTSRDDHLDSTTMALVSTGRYRAIYTVQAADALEELIFAFSVVEGGATRLYGNVAQVVDTTAVDFTSADRAKLDALHDTRCTEARMAELDAANLPGVTDGIKAKTDLIPAAGPASAADYTGARAAKLDNLDALVSSRAAPGAAMTLTLSQSAGMPGALDKNLGDCLRAAWGQGAGKWALNTITKVLTIYAPDGVTVLAQFDIDSVAEPTSRTPA